MSASPPARPVLRPARPDDAGPIEDLMRASVERLFPAYYDDVQTASAARHTARLDPALVDDGTYYVHEAGGAVVACGGWSARAKLFAGPSDVEGQDPLRRIDPATEPARIRAMFVRADWARHGLAREIMEHSARTASEAGFSTLVLVATLPGVPFYRACGFRQRDRVRIEHPDGVRLDGLRMDRPALA